MEICNSAVKSRQLESIQVKICIFQCQDMRFQPVDASFIVRGHGQVNAPFFQEYQLASSLCLFSGAPGKGDQFLA
jgi:hypothetical protein